MKLIKWIKKLFACKQKQERIPKAFRELFEPESMSEGSSEDLKRDAEKYYSKQHCHKIGHIIGIVRDSPRVGIIQKITLVTSGEDRKYIGMGALRRFSFCLKCGGNPNEKSDCDHIIGYVPRGHDSLVTDTQHIEKILTSSDEHFTFCPNCGMRNRKLDYDKFYKDKYSEEISVLKAALMRTNIELNQVKRLHKRYTEMEDINFQARLGEEIEKLKGEKDSG